MHLRHAGLPHVRHQWRVQFLQNWHWTRFSFPGITTTSEQQQQTTTTTTEGAARMACLCPRATDERISRRFYHVFARRLGSAPRQRARRKERPLSTLNRAANSALVDQPIRCKRVGRQDVSPRQNKTRRQYNKTQKTSRATAEQRPFF